MTSLHWALFRRSFAVLVSTALLVVIGVLLAKPILIDYIQDMTLREKYFICSSIMLCIFAVNYLSVLRLQLAGEEDILFSVSLSISTYVRSYLLLTTFRILAATAVTILVGMCCFILYDLDLGVVHRADFITMFIWIFLIYMLLLLQNKIRNSDLDSDGFVQKSLRYAAHMFAGLLIFKSFLIMPLLGFVVFSIYLTVLLYLGRSILFRYFPGHLKRNIGLSVGGMLLVIGIFNLMILFQTHRESLLIWGQR